MRVIGKLAILRFSEEYPDALVPLANWYRITRGANWNSLAEGRNDFGRADLAGRRSVNYQTKRVFILRIPTHAEYAKGDWRE